MAFELSLFQLSVVSTLILSIFVSFQTYLKSSQVKSTLFRQDGPISTRLASIGALRLLIIDHAYYDLTSLAALIEGTIP